LEKPPWCSVNKLTWKSRLAALADPKHDQHEELLEWRGPFDPEAFEAKRATKEMRKVKP
jgi:hypothetical protein